MRIANEYTYAPLLKLLKPSQVQFRRHPFPREKALYACTRVCSCDCREKKETLARRERERERAREGDNLADMGQQRGYILSRLLLHWKAEHHPYTCVYVCMYVRIRTRLVSERVVSWVGRCKALWAWSSVLGTIDVWTWNWREEFPEAVRGLLCA